MASSSSSTVNPVASSLTEEGKMVRLRTLDGEKFEVEEAVAVQFQTIRHTIEYDCAGNVIPLPNVTASILSKVLEHPKKHVVDDKEDDGLKTWDTEFVNVDGQVLLDLVLAANYLDVKGLLDLTCQTITDTDAVRNFLNYTPEEEEAVRNENRWASE